MALLHVAMKGQVADWPSRTSDWGRDQVSSSSSRGAAGEDNVTAAQLEVTLNSDCLQRSGHTSGADVGPIVR